MIIFITFLISIFSGLAEAILDIVQIEDIFSSAKKRFRFFKKNSWYFDPKESWKNKYKDLEDYAKISWYKFGYHWYYFGLHSPLYREAFPLSSTLLVFLTDAFHLSKWAMSISSFLVSIFCVFAGSIELGLAIALTYFLVSMFSFHLFFHWMKKP